MFRLDQKGVSLPLVLAIMGIVIANTYYFMSVEKSAKDQNIKRGTEIDDNSERIRVGAFLSDSTICTSNFGGKTISAINTPGTTNLVKGSSPAVPFLTTTDVYSRGTLKFTDYKISKVIPDTVPGIPEGKRYAININYSIVDKSKGITTTKKKTIRIPFFMILNPSSQITTCYTEADQNFETVNNAVTAACKGPTARLTIVDGLNECHHDVLPLQCPEGNVINGIKIGDAGNTVTENRLQFLCGSPATVAAGGTAKCAELPIKTFVSEILSTASVNCNTTDNNCSAGQYLMMGSGTAPICATGCSALDEMMVEMNSNGTARCVKRTSVCTKPNEYPKQINPDGTVVCTPYTIVNKKCLATELATDINPEAASESLMLGCKAFVKNKACPTPGVYTFVKDFQTSAIPGCSAYTY